MTEAFYELVYAERAVADLIKKRFPSAEITDARDQIHEERFEVNIEGVEPLDFYKYSIDEGFFGACLCMRVRFYSGEPDKLCDDIVAYAKTKREAGDAQTS